MQNCNRRTSANGDIPVNPGVLKQLDKARQIAQICAGLVRLAEKLQSDPEGPASERDMAKLIVDALLEAGVDLRSGPSLEEMKSILIQAHRAAHATHAAVPNCV